MKERKGKGDGKEDEGERKEWDVGKAGERKEER